MKGSLSPKKYFVKSSLYLFLWRKRCFHESFAQKCVRVNFRHYHSTVWKLLRLSLTHFSESNVFTFGATKFFILPHCARAQQSGVEN